MTGDAPLTDAELDAMQQCADAASKGPWQAFIEGRDFCGGRTFIRVGGDHDDEDDMYVSRELKCASDPDLDFIAGARQDIPRLIAEVRRLREQLARRTT